MNVCLNFPQKNKRTLFVFFISISFLISLFIAAPQAAFAANVENVRIGENPGRTRLVLDIDTKIDFSYFVLSDPYRIVVDLPEVTWQLSGKGSGKGQGLITNYRYGLFQPGVSRLVLDVNQPVAIERVFMLEPSSGFAYRLVVDLKAGPNWRDMA